MSNDKKNYCDKIDDMHHKCTVIENEYYQCKHYKPDMLFPSQCAFYAVGFCISYRAQCESEKQEEI